jgi:hypothetical protein
VLVVDDRILLSVLAGRASVEHRPQLEAGELFTTGYWYYRLGRAIHRSEVTGQLSGAFESLEDDEQAAVLRGLDELPPQVGLLSLRKLVPVMSLLDVGAKLNLLAAEALAACVVLNAGLAVTTDSPPLRAGADRLQLGYRIHTV